MATIEISRSQLKRLVGKKFDLDEELNKLKAEYRASGDVLRVELEDSNRPDLWSVEGIAREIKGKARYKVAGNAGKIDAAKAPRVRPYIGASVVKGVKLSDEVIKGLMATQDRLDTTLGRSRETTSIGLYNYDMLKMPLRYTTTKPDENSFVPLESISELTPAEIVKMHPKGKEYGHIIEAEPRYPVFLDSETKVLSLPPIINSNDLGRINNKTKNVLVEVTGTDKDTVNKVLLLMTLCIADRGGKIYSVKVKYKNRTQTTPEIKRPKWTLKLADVETMLGFKLNPSKVAAMLKSMNYEVVSKSSKVVKVKPPCYRTDIMHPVDIIEDIAIAYGYGNIEPKEPELPTHGSLNDIELFSDKVRDLMVGAGYLETMGFVLSSRHLQEQTVNLEKVDLIEIENPMSETYSCLRPWLIPSLLQLLGRNTHKDYPQRVFELGEVVVPKKLMPRTKWKLCAVEAQSDTTFTSAKSVLDALMAGLGLKYKVRRKNHPTFIPGRSGAVVVNSKEVGVIGELHPKVLDNLGIAVPVSAFELDVERLMKG